MPSFVELVDRFEGRLYNFLIRRTTTPADAEDLTQETLVKAWQHLHRYRPQWQFSTWLFTIARRAAISHLRRTQRRSAAPMTFDPPEGDVRPVRTDPANRIADQEACARIWDAADQLLPDAQRSALWLRYAEEISISEIARILGKSQVGVRVLLFRARRTLAENDGVRLGLGVGSRAAENDDLETVGPARVIDALSGEVSCRG